MPRLVLQDVSKVFESPARKAVTAVDRVSLTAEPNECLVLLGPSGSGKTTLLRLVAGLETPSSGEIRLDDTLITRLSPQQRPVAMVFQEPALYPHMSVAQNLAFGLQLRHCPQPEINRRVGQVAEMLGLRNCLAAAPAELSGGQRQRVALGRALVREAKTLLLDEPLANLDPQWRAQLREDISVIRENLGATFIYVTHDHLDAMLIGDRVALLRDGRLQQIASPDVLYHHPDALFVAEFFGFPAMNLFSGNLVRYADHLVFNVTAAAGSYASTAISAPSRRIDAHQTSADTEQWSLQLDSSCLPPPIQNNPRPVILGIRPEHISCSASLPTDKPFPSVSARIDRVRRTGPELYLAARAGSVPFMARAPMNFHPDLSLQYSFCFETKFACLFDPITGARISPP